MDNNIKSKLSKALHHALSNPQKWGIKKSGVNVFLEIYSGHNESYQDGQLEISLDDFDGLYYIIDNVKVSYYYDGAEITNGESTIDWSDAYISMYDPSNRPWIEYIDSNKSYNITDLVDTETWLDTFEEVFEENFDEQAHEHFINNCATEADHFDLDEYNYRKHILLNNKFKSYE